jgi:phage-related protein
LLALGATFFALKDQLPMVTESIKSIVIAFKDKILPPLKNLWENVLKPFITTLVEGIGKTLPTIFEGIGSIIDGLISIFQGDFTEGFKSLFGGAGKILKGATDFILNFFGTSTDEIGASIKQFFTDILDGIKAPFIAVYDFIKPGGTGDQMLAEYIYEPIENFIENVKTFFTDLWDGAVQAVKDTFAGIGNFFSSIVDRC